jgi:4-hydroxybenzoate polyprenyltransferase
MGSYVVMVALLAWFGVAQQMPWPYHTGLAIAGAMMGYHYVLIRGRSREGCFHAFRHNNWIGLAIFAGIVASYHL